MDNCTACRHELIMRDLSKGYNGDEFYLDNIDNEDEIYRLTRHTNPWCDCYHTCLGDY